MSPAGKAVMGRKRFSLKHWVRSRIFQQEELRSVSKWKRQDQMAMALDRLDGNI